MGFCLLHEQIPDPPEERALTALFGAQLLGLSSEGSPVAIESCSSSKKVDLNRMVIRLACGKSRSELLFIASKHMVLLLFMSKQYKRLTKTRVKLLCLYRISTLGCSATDHNDHPRRLACSD